MVVPPAEVPVVPDDSARGPEEVAVVGSAARRRALRWGLRLVELGPVLILAVLVIVMGILSPYFFRSNNLTNLGFQTAVIAARRPASASGCDGQPSQNSSSTRGCVMPRTVRPPRQARPGVARLP